jgi:hypothetical protein
VDEEGSPYIQEQSRAAGGEEGGRREEKRPVEVEVRWVLVLV